MTVRYLLDTNIVSAPISKAPDVAIVRKLERHGPDCAIAAPVGHELIYGCRRMPKGKRRTAVETYLRDVIQASFPVLPYDESSARWHGEERARLESIGRPVPFVDGQIAAIAHANGLILVTTNTRDFTPFRELTVENWAKHPARTQ